MFRTISPEQAGVSAEWIDGYVRYLEENELSTHDVIMARGNDIFFEKYWSPFNADFAHRMYSVTKSFVALAIGFLWQEGKIDLDRCIMDYFPEETKGIDDENMRAQTVRCMLMMSTAKPAQNWFTVRGDDRVRTYFDNPASSRKPGQFFEYDSSGSFVLCALVERITGMRLEEFLREKLFSKIGVSESAHLLKCPGGHSWGDSALICTPRDLLTTARFVLNGGSWNGEQLLSADYMKAATSYQISTEESPNRHEYDHHGYGYQIWMNHMGSYSFNGMGCQFAIMIPKYDMLFVYNGDNQGKSDAGQILIDGFFDQIVKRAECSFTPPDTPVRDTYDYGAGCDFKLMTARGEAHTPVQDKINGKTFILSENPMGIKRFSLSFGDDGCVFEYENEQGNKRLPFGMCENIFAEFPQEGYSADVGSVFTKGHYYKSASSAAWVSENRLYLKTQIIDDYFGRLNSYFTFTDNRVELSMIKTAEDFLNEYSGDASGELLGE